MPTNKLRMMVAAALLSVAAVPAVAAPLTHAESMDWELRERHEARDVKSGDFQPHGRSTPDRATRSAPRTPAVPPQVTEPPHVSPSYQ